MTHRSFSPPTSLALATVTILLSCFLAIGCGNKPDNDPNSGVTNPCANVTCTEPGEVCQNGQCVNPNKGGACDGITCKGDAQCSEGKCLCGTTECESGKICKNDQCVDEANACDNVTCTGDAVCSEGSCLCNGNTCSDDQICREGVCLDKCGATECQAGLGCHNNSCVSKCDTTCGNPGEKCVNNLCIDPCESITCKAGTETCVDGNCVTKNTDSCSGWQNSATEITLDGDNFNESLFLDFSSESELNASTDTPLTECPKVASIYNEPTEILTGTYKRTVVKIILSNPSSFAVDADFFGASSPSKGIFLKLFKGCDASKTVEACAFSTDSDYLSLGNNTLALPADTYYLVVETTQPSKKIGVTFNGLKLEADVAHSPCQPNRMSCDAGKVVECINPPQPNDPMVEEKIACLDNECKEFTPYDAACRGEYCSDPIEIDGATAAVHNFKGSIYNYRFNDYFYPTDSSCDLSQVGVEPMGIFFHVSNLKKDQKVVFTSRVNPSNDKDFYDILFKPDCSKVGACSYANHDTPTNSNTHTYTATKDNDSVFIIVYRSLESFASSTDEPFEFNIDVKAAP